MPPACTTQTPTLTCCQTSETPDDAGRLGILAFVLEVLELAEIGILVRKDNRLISTFADVNPAVMRTVPDGRLLVEAMNLKLAEEEDAAELAEVLRRLGTIDVKEGSNRAETVVPPGSPPDQRLVKIDLRVVQTSPPPLTPEVLAPESKDPPNQK